MSILIDGNTHAIVQGITGRHGSFHTRLMLDYGTDIVAGVTPGREGEEVHGIPVYDEIEGAMREHPSANALIQFVPAPLVKDATFEAIEAGLKTLVLIAEHVPLHDMMAVKLLAERNDVVIVGPNTPGLISPGKCKMGIMPGDVHMPGEVGVVSRSGTLTYEAVAQLTDLGIGQSTCLGIGGDPLIGSTHTDILKLFEADPGTKMVVLIGEIGGVAEQQAAEFIKTMTKPVIAFICGVTAPPGRRMGHAGAIITGSSGTAKEKIAALTAAGATIAPSPAEIGSTTKKVLESMA